MVWYLSKRGSLFHTANVNEISEERKSFLFPLIEIEWDGYDLMTL